MASSGRTPGTREVAQAVRQTALAAERGVEPLIFICYSHLDSDEKEELEVHIRGLRGPLGLRNSGYMLAWSDTDIPPGVDWRKEIREKLAKVRIAILLVTPGFLNSDFIAEDEVPRILHRRSKAGKRLDIIPVLGKGCAYHPHEWLASMQLRPRDGVFVWAPGSDKDKYLAEITAEVWEILRPLVPSPPRKRSTRQKRIIRRALAAMKA